jgi:hypothetical protein
MSVLTVAGLTVGWLVPLSVPTAAPAFASCSGQPLHEAVGGHENPSSNRFGDYSSLWVNNFTSHQFNTWRAVAILRGSNNFAESGWFTSETASDQLAHPYRTWVNDGVPTTNNYNNISLTPRDAYHQFKVMDSNGDKMWEFWYDGSQMGNPKAVNMSSGDPITEAERQCTTDSLWAHFNSLKSIRASGGGFKAYSQVVFYVNNTTGVTYLWCYDSSTSYHVKQTC